MKIIREVRPNGLPIMLQAIIGDCGAVTEGSLMVFPLLDLLDGTVVGEELDLADSRLAERLNLALHNDTT